MAAIMTRALRNLPYRRLGLARRLRLPSSSSTIAGSFIPPTKVEQIDEGPIDTPGALLTHCVSPVAQPTGCRRQDPEEAGMSKLQRRPRGALRKHQGGR